MTTPPTSSVPLAPSIPPASTRTAAAPPPPPASATRRHVDAHFVPWWPHNPYHSELARHLADCDVTVRPESRLKDILALPPSRRPDIIHLHALPPVRFHPKQLARLLRFCLRLRHARRTGIRLVWTVHNLADHGSSHPMLDRRLARWCYRMADAVIIHTPAARAAIEAHWKLTRPDASIIHHGHFIDCYPSRVGRDEARRALGVSDGSLVYLFLGNIRPNKGVRRLVQEFRQIAAPSSRLIIAGETASSALCSEIEREIDGSSSILFRPEFVADEQIQHYMAAADVVVFPYTRALTSGALILAMSFGRACIAPRMGALGDTLDDAGGFLYEPDDESGLRSALRAASDSRAQLARMGAHNRARAEQWGWHEAACRTASTYRTCLNGNPATGSPESGTQVQRPDTRTAKLGDSHSTPNTQL